MKLQDGSKVYFQYVNLKGIDNRYRHPTIRFIVVDPERAQDADDEMYGNIIMQFEYQTNGPVLTDAWYGGSIEGLTRIDSYYELRNVNKILRTWERYMKNAPYDCRPSGHKRLILGFLKRYNIQRVVINPERYNQWKLYKKPHRGIK